MLVCANIATKTDGTSETSSSIMKRRLSGEG